MLFKVYEKLRLDIRRRHDAIDREFWGYDPYNHVGSKV